MTVYVVNYDLRKPGRNYQPLWDRLAAWKAVRGLESMWFIVTSSTAVQIRDDLKAYVDSNDGLFVGILGGAAWNNLQGQSGQFVLNQFAAA